MSELKSEILRLLKEDEEFRYAVAGLIGLEEILKRLDRHEKELIKLREDMNKLREDMNMLREDMNRLREDMIRDFDLVNRHISALGARLGIMTEEAFREGLRDILEKELGLKVERWTHFDNYGLVYGYPSRVEVDVAIKDEKLILIEVSSHIKTSDIYEFRRKAELYEKVTGKRPDRLLIVTPYAEPKALEAAKKHKIEIYTKV